ncbi:hypothetical protein NSS76_17905 [Bacillus sp. FSL R5-0654]|uniref:hypothetical protein n=1 Tax=Bacillus sp. FSL R5-0654 TaxID=2954589 RepID=UPI0030FB608D
MEKIVLTDSYQENIMELMARDADVVVAIGPKAKKPMKIKIPLMISGIRCKTFFG